MREHASLSGIQALDHNERYRTSLSIWQRAIISYMLGRPDVARQHLSATIARIEQEDRWNAAGLLEVQHRFAAALEQRMAQGPWHP